MSQLFPKMVRLYNVYCLGQINESVCLKKNEKKNKLLSTA